jgi:lysophospholipase L1-like esterase
MKIFCYGDSITRGENDDRHGGWADRLKTLCVKRHLELGGEEACVYNLGIGGEDTRSLRTRFVPELNARRANGERFVVMLGYGANDAARRAGAPAVPVGSYLDNLRFCVDETRRQGGDVLLLNVTPVAAAADGVPNARGTLRSNERIRAYNDALRTAFADQGAAVLDVHAEFMKRDLETLFVPDGVHPNASGHEAIYRLVKARLGF